MQKAHSRINWENYPSEKTAVNKINLNKMDGAIDEIDNRVINLDTTKATKVEVSELFSGVSFDESTGIITFTRKNGSQITIDTKLEKLAINFAYDPVEEKLVITLDDGTKQYVDLSALITVYEFLDSDTIAFAIEGGKVKAIVKEGSIQGKHLQPDYLADITGFKGFKDQYVWDREDYGQILFSNNEETLHYNGKSIEPYDLRRPSSLEEMKKALQNIKL